MNINAQFDLKYQVPSDEILKLADISPRPSVIIDEKAKYIVFAQRNSMYKTLGELAEKEYKLGGLRINPANFGISRTTYQNELTVKNILTGAINSITGAPKNAMFGSFTYSPDQSKLALYNNTGNDLELWILDITSAIIRKIENIHLNEVTGRSIAWCGNNALIVKTVNIEFKKLIIEEPIPEGPVIQESSGVKAPNRTYQDLLKNGSDEQNFDFFTSVNLVYIELNGGQSVILKDKRISSFNVSPDNNFILVQSIEKPFSYIVPYYRFPINISIFNKSGILIKTLANIPLADNIPIAFDAVRKGIREIEWRNDKPAGLFWVEALDEGDPEIKVNHRDALFLLNAPFEKPKHEFTRLVNRFHDINWGNDNLAIVIDYWWKTRNTKTYMINPSIPNDAPSPLFDRNAEEVYTDPGNFVMSRNNFGKQILKFSKNQASIYLSGEGYSPEGNRPFLDLFTLKDSKTLRLWRADGLNTYERIVKIIDPEKGILLTSIESKQENPNYYIRNINSKTLPLKITDFQHPYLSFKGVYKEKIKYKREDGVDLTATLYLPANYDIKSGIKLPLIMWAYPREFKSAQAAGQISSSPNEFTYLSYGTPVYWAAKGYAILDETDFPIVGEGKNEPNDSYIPQLVANAKAAIDAVNKLGYINTSKVAVGGHSYGAFMTANLLTHCHLFACGVARSGAYNRTLTPFGFQAEERTLWQAPEVYSQMSPFNHVDSIKTPILLIHGIADNNPGTFTLQSERYFQALKGHGAVARLVLLPYESHGYAARASIMHVLWEQDQWFEKYLKN